MSTNVPWWSKRKGKGKGKEKSSEPAPAPAAAKSSTEAPPPKAPEVPKATTPKAPATPKVAAPKPDSKQKESERKRKLAEASQVANGSDEYSAAFRPPPGKFVIVTDTSMAAQAICDRFGRWFEVSTERKSRSDPPHQWCRGHLHVPCGTSSCNV